MAAFKKCPWTPEEDMRLVTYISRHGIWNWSQMPKHAGLSRSGKSCRLRWMNYLDPQVIRGNYTQEEDEIIINMRHVGAGWSAIAARLTGRTDNEIKNRWHTHLKKRIANINVVEDMEPYREQSEVKIEAVMDCDYTNDHVTPEAQNMDEGCGEDPISPYRSDFGAYSNNINVPPTFATSADPHTSFWREPFALENVYDNDEYATYVDPQYGVPKPQDWFREPFYTYCDLLYMKSRNF